MEKILLATKNDLYDERVIPYEKGVEFAKDHDGLEFIEVSSKSGLKGFAGDG